MASHDIRLLSASKLITMAAAYGLRQQGKKGTWVIRKSVTDPRTHLEHTFKRSTKTTDLRLALYRAMEWVDTFTERVHGGKSLPTLPSTSAGASLKNISATYLLAASCSPATRAKNLGHLRQLVSDLIPAEADFDTISCDILDGRAARSWLLARKSAAERAHLPHDIAACEQAKRGANALYRQARSVFSHRMITAYLDAGLRVPATCREFAEQSYLVAAPPPQSEQLPPAVLEKIRRLLPRLRKVRPAIYAAFLLMYRGGLRNKEAVQARWSWLRPPAAEGADFTLLLETTASYKPKARARTVNLHPHIIAELRDLIPAEIPGQPAAADPHLIPAATDFERYTIVARWLNKFLRACGVDLVKGKRAYRLRGHAITELILRDGMSVAQQFAGHTTARTTAIYQGAALPYKALAL